MRGLKAGLAVVALLAVDLPDDAVWTVDGMVLELPGDSEDIVIHAP